LARSWCAPQLVACSEAPTRPDLARLYRIGSEGADTTPVIVIPGLFGSRLRDRTTGAEIWPGSAQMILFDDYHSIGLDFERATLQAQPDNIEASGITDAALGRDFYGQIIDALQRFGGYVVLFGGDCTHTPARLALEEEAGTPVVRLYPDDIRHRVPGVRYDELMLEPGDGKVTKPSLLARETLDPSAPQSEDSFIPIAYRFFLCERHDRLTGNINFQDNLLNVLLTRSLPWEMNAPAP
jgi:hypothetical protein